MSLRPTTFVAVLREYVASLALLLMIVAITVIVIPSGSPLRGVGGSIAKSPLLDGIAMVVAVLFAIVGTIYGVRSGSVQSPGQVPKLMGEGIKQMAPVLVLFFAIAQFLAYFDWTRLGEVLAVGSAELLDNNNVRVPVIFVLVLLLLTVVNIMVTSGSAMWSIAAPVLVPMLLLLAAPAETTQALFRIADSGSTAITPMSPYFVMALGFLQRYRKSAGIGTLASYVAAGGRHHGGLDGIVLRVVGAGHSARARRPSAVTTSAPSVHILRLMGGPGEGPRPKTSMPATSVRGSAPHPATTPTAGPVARR